MSKFIGKNEAKQAVEENKQEFADAYNNIKTVLKTQIKAGDEGHKYRTIYLICRAAKYHPISFSHH
jgi:hypothetical protein